ncbi:carbohydrate kinase family protein [Candidatus Galacturonibacter soehngenii]|uniref:Carbohydrate kinase family protein n=1 Tax=Candidatus Galacturonatibacter soehngenii TaxID=2307010 RepID=A0A7V7QMU6_9FIRM|nr:carbohydrate kinase family protein [Candidatus Galacturonibacter soehngenii]KAB1440084.1 carbohydrate kinase family protein [Candidatus Galacturonibacter soehngenii]
MSKILVMGPIYAETTVKVSSIPLPDNRLIDNNFGIITGFSGHGYNVSRALKKLGDSVRFLSFCGNDSFKLMLDDELAKTGISNEYVIPCLDATPHTIVLFSDEKNRQIINDLKESNEVAYDESIYEKAIIDCDTVVFCNSNYARPFLKKAKDAGKMIVTDVHDIKDMDDEYNKEFMQYADVLCLNHANLKEPYEDFIKEIENKYHNEIIILGMGEKGAILYVKKDNFIGTFPTVRTRKIVNTLGAGDSQLSAFVHFYKKTGNPYYSLKAAILFASYKIGNPSAAHGFLTEEQVEIFYNTIWK